MTKRIILSLIFLFFITLNISAQTFGSFTDTRDNKTYKTVQIGDQIWMAENLKYWYKGDTEYYEGNNANYQMYGYLYPWEVANKVCPEDWHLPSLIEWFTLINSFGHVYDDDYHAPTLKELRKTPKVKRKAKRKLAKNTFEALRNGGSSGFNFLFGGHCDPDAYQGVSLSNMPGYYYNLGSIGHFWSSSDLVESGMFKKIKAQGFHFSKFGKKFYPLAMRKGMCFSIRCVKDLEEIQEEKE